ncbi:MAG: YceI family protein [Chloroflexota bacterium]|nr:YceI family protein [Chloroflexota bacterium]
MSTWKIDPAHTDVAFSAKHMMVTTVRGKFDGVDGEIELDEADPTAATGEIRVSAASLSTGFEARDQHLRSADFFDAEQHPDIVARVASVEAKGNDDYLVTADVTIRGVTRPVTFDAELNGVVPGMHGGRHAGIRLVGTVNREDWGLNWNVALEKGSWLVGREIKLDIDVALNEVVVAAEAPGSVAA